MIETRRCRGLGSRTVILLWALGLWGTAFMAAAQTSSETPTQSAEESDKGQSTIDFETLRHRLESQGWKVERDAQGGLLLFPGAAAKPGVAKPEAPAAEKPSSEGAPESAQAMDVEGLRSVLEPHGWKVERDAQGGVLLFPGAAAKPGVAKPEVPAAEKPSSEGAPGSAQAMDVEGLRSVLEPHGWRVESDAQGGVLLFPGAGGDVKEKPVEQELPKAGQIMDIERLRSLLEPHGWRVQRNSSGDIILIPKGLSNHGELSSSQKKANRLTGMVMEPIKRGQIEVPIDTWQKAHDLAASWIEASAPETLLVGKIREVHRIYVVSVVGTTTAHPLQHQLVIRKEDGHLFPVY